jgi:hypothetical protein
MENQEYSILDEVLERIGFGLHDLPHVRRQLDDPQRCIALAPIFHILREAELARGIDATLSNQTMIFRTTIADGPRHLVREPNSRPASGMESSDVC